MKKETQNGRIGRVTRTGVGRVTKIYYQCKFPVPLLKNAGEIPNKKVYYFHHDIDLSSRSHLSLLLEREFYFSFLLPNYFSFLCFDRYVFSLLLAFALHRQIVAYTLLSTCFGKFHLLDVYLHPSCHILHQPLLLLESS